jgi:hypothetical protein
MDLSGQPHARAILPSGNETQYPFNKGLDWPHIWSGRCGEELGLLPLPGFEPQIVQSVA